MKQLFYLKRGTQEKTGKASLWDASALVAQWFSSRCACTIKLWDSRKQRLVGKCSESVMTLVKNLVST